MSTSIDYQYGHVSLEIQLEQQLAVDVLMKANAILVETLISICYLLLFEIA